MKFEYSFVVDSLSIPGWFTPDQLPECELFVVTGWVSQFDPDRKLEIKGEPLYVMRKAYMYACQLSHEYTNENDLFLEGFNISLLKDRSTWHHQRIYVSRRIYAPLLTQEDE